MIVHDTPEAWSPVASSSVLPAEYRPRETGRPVAVFVTGNKWMQSVIRECAPAGVDVRFLDNPADEPRVRELLPLADLLVTIKLPGAWVPLLRRCKLVQLQSVGSDGVDRAALTKAGIPLALTPEGTVVGVAEHTLLLMLAVYKRLTAVHAAVLRGEFDPVAWRPQCHFLQGKTVGLVGFGRIGRRVAHLVNAFEADVIYSDVAPAHADVATKLGAEHVSFDALLSRTDVVSVHTPLTPETYGLFGAAAFARIKSGAVFVNTGRGETYDMMSLYDALKRGHLGGAGLDVFDPEPPPADHPLLHLPNVVCTPHMATGTVEAHREKAAARFENLRRVLACLPAMNVAPPSGA
jgi:D-3-phosphoglycerate dehydrogenase